LGHAFWAGGHALGRWRSTWPVCVCGAVRGDGSPVPGPVNWHCARPARLYALAPPIQERTAAAAAAAFSPGVTSPPVDWNCAFPHPSVPLCPCAHRPISRRQPRASGRLPHLGRVTMGPRVLAMVRGGARKVRWGHGRSAGGTEGPLGSGELDGMGALMALLGGGVLLGGIAGRYCQAVAC
jgi:hypothetical protein